MIFSLINTFKSPNARRFMAVLAFLLLPVFSVIAVFVGTLTHLWIGLKEWLADLAFFVRYDVRSTIVSLSNTVRHGDYA